MTKPLERLFLGIVDTGLSTPKNNLLHLVACREGLVEDGVADTVGKPRTHATGNGKALVDIQKSCPRDVLVTKDRLEEAGVIFNVNHGGDDLNKLHRVQVPNVLGKTLARLATASAPQPQHRRELEQNPLEQTPCFHRRSFFG